MECTSSFFQTNGIKRVKQFTVQLTGHSFQRVQLQRRRKKVNETNKPSIVNGDSTYMSLAKFLGKCGRRSGGTILTEISCEVTSWQSRKGLRTRHIRQTDLTTASKRRSMNSVQIPAMTSDFVSHPSPARPFPPLAMHVCNMHKKLRKIRSMSVLQKNVRATSECVYTPRGTQNSCYHVGANPCGNDPHC